MKISNTKAPRKSVDFNMLLAEYAEQYDVIHHVRIDDEDFIFRILGRHEYKKIVNTPGATEMDMEDMVCDTCLLYPEDYDFDNAPAGLPRELSEMILENSFLDGVESTLRLLDHYKEEMEELENQMICIISEAFPAYTIDEIESWNNLRFCKMFSRAEWKFNNLKDAEIKDVSELIRNILALKEEGLDDEEIATVLAQEEAREQGATTFRAQPAQEQQIQMPTRNTQDNQISRNGKQKLTPEKLRELEKMKQMFPEINWTEDELLNHGADDAMSNMTSESVVAPALRPGWGR